tara:strand:+ start:8829 stop:9221 length:393 start_codon:yes stop_codon:yes gene_type:complete
MQIGQLQHKGIRTESAAASFYLDTSITGYSDIGKPVSITDDFTVGFGADGAEIIGYLESYEDRITETVKMGGVSWHMCAEFTYTGTDPTAGSHVVADGAGNVKLAGAGAGLNTLVCAVDTTNKVVSIIFR